MARLTSPPIGVLDRVVLQHAALLSQNIRAEMNLHIKSVHADGEEEVLLGPLLAIDQVGHEDLHRSPGEDLQRPVQGSAAVVDDGALLDLSLVELGFGKGTAQAVGQEDGVGVGLDDPVVVLVLARVVDLLPGRNEDGGVQVRAPRASLGNPEVGVGQNLRPISVAKVHADAAVHRRLLAREDAPVLARVGHHEALLGAAGQHQREAEERSAGSPEGGRRAGVHGRRLLPHQEPGVRIAQGGREPHAPLVALLRGVAHLHLQPAATLRRKKSFDTEASPVLDQAVVALQDPVLAEYRGAARPQVDHAAGLLPLRRAQAEPVLGHDPAHVQVDGPLLVVCGGVPALLQGDVLALLGHAETMTTLDLERRRTGTRKPRDESIVLEALQLQLSLQEAPLPRVDVHRVGLAPGPGRAVRFCTAV
mmetsp:Transcript_42990/g.133628  ORF Transcript_42990/g.133628 Transcript_42990/m.133628 type:complete len:420 (+) Transcript_42990:225-1484(+)